MQPRYLWFVAVALLAVSCAAPGPTSTPASSGGQPKSGGAIAIATGNDPSNFDISIAGRSGGNSESVAAAYEALLTFKSGAGIDYNQMTVAPLLTERWDVSSDSRTYTFHLRKGVKFADLPPVNGREVTSIDVKFSYEYSSRTGEFKDSKLPPAQFAFYFEGMERVEAPEPYTAVVSFKDPFSPFLSYAAAYQNPILPREIYEANGDFKDQIVGTGIFQVDEKSTQRGTRWVWKKNANYWQPGRPYIDEERWIILPDIPSRFPAFVTRQVDALSYTQLSPSELESMKQQAPGSVFYEYLSGGGSGNIYLNNRKGPLADERVRKAYLLGLDRDELIKTLAGGKGKWALAGAFDDIYSEEEVKQVIKYDPVEAKRLLTDAGYADGVELEWMFPARGYNVDLAPEGQLTQAQLKKVGINLKLVPVDFNDWLQRTRVGVSTFEVVPRQQAVKEDVDAYAFASFHSKSTRNYSGVNDPALDKLLEAQRAELDSVKRKQLVRQAVRQVADHAYGLRTFAGYSYHIWQPYLKDQYPHNGREYWPLTDSWLDK